MLSFVLYLTFGLISAAFQRELKDYKNHPCIRQCGVNTPMTCEYEFTLEHYYTLSKACYDCPFNKTDCSRPHCVPADGNSRAILTVNRMLPGPAIYVCFNDTVVVKVNNGLEGGEGTTIHWHGVQVSPYMDGVDMVTQCPIPSHSSFEYRFLASTPGTHYWHSHSGLQNADGIFGAFIIREPPQLDVHLGRYDVDKPDYIIMLNDWMIEPALSRMANVYHNGGNNKPASMLINGKGVYHDFDRDNETFHTPYEEFHVQPGRRYRLRIIGNGLNNCPILFSIDQHNITIIASDGAPVDPVIVDSFYLFSGERYDVVLHTDQSVGNYWIRASGNNLCVQKKAHQLAIIRYEGANDEEPTKDKDWNLEIPGTQFNPVNIEKSDAAIYASELNSKVTADEALRELPDRTIYLSMDFNYIDNYRINDPVHYSLSDVEPQFQVRTQQIDHISMVLPPAPVQSQFSDVPQELFCNKNSINANCKHQYCACTHLIQLGLGEIAEIVLVDEGMPYDSSHPFHLHGNYFRVVAMDKLNRSTTVEEVKKLNENGMIHRNLENSPLKDTVNVMDGGYTIIRFHAKNPGFWLFHCHWTYHTMLGMGLIIQVGTVNEQPKKPKNFPKCGPWKFEGYVEDEVNENPTCPTSDGIKIWTNKCTMLVFITTIITLLQ